MALRLFNTMGRQTEDVDGVDPVVEGGGGQHQIGRARHLDRLGADVDGHRAQVELVVVDAGGAQAVDVLLARRRIEEGDRFAIIPGIVNAVLLMTTVVLEIVLFP